VEGDHKASVCRFTAFVGNAHVGVCSDLHADPASQHGGSRANKEGDGSIWELYFAGPGLVDCDEDQNSEDDAEDGKEGVFLFEEGVSALKKVIIIIKNREIRLHARVSLLVMCAVKGYLPR
jgi:hypothetical protein